MNGAITSGTTQSTGGEKTPVVFIVDDEPSVASACAKLVETVLPHVTTRRFTNPEEAVAAIIENAPACLILDMYMPKMNGEDLLRKIREQQVTVPVIGITGMAEGQEASPFAEQVDELLQKPFLPAKLLDLVEKMVQAALDE